MDVRPYSGQNDLDLMKTLLVAYRSDMAYTWHMGDLIINLTTNLHPHSPSEVVYLWFDDAELVGFSVLVPRNSALNLFVHPRWVGTGSEKYILLWSIDRLCELVGNPEYVRIFNVPDSDSARVALLKDQGFDLWDHHGLLMVRNLDDAIKQPELPEGFISTHVQDERDVAQWIECIQSAFPRSNPILSDYISLTQTQAYFPKLDSVIKNSDGKVVALSQGWFDPNENTGLIEPVGTHPNYQRLGLGRAVMYRTFLELQGSGAKRVELHTRVLNSTARALYERVGMRIGEQLFNYQKAMI